MKKMKWLAVAMSLVVLLLSACGSKAVPAAGTAQPSSAPDKAAQDKKKIKMVVGGKGFSEQYLLAQLVGQLMQNNTDYDVSINESGFAASSFINQAMKDGKVDVFVDYTGTGFLNVLKGKLAPEDTKETVYKKVKEGYEKELGFTWLEPLGFTNTFTILLREEKMKELNISTFSDLVKHAPNLVLGIDNTFYDRQDGLKGLSEKYGYKFKDIKQMEIPLAFPALAEKKIDVLVAYSTDGRIPALKLAALKDDKNYFPPYYAAPIVTLDFAKKYPDAVQVINKLAGKINDQTMSKLNAKADVEKKAVADVAKEFLIENGLIPKK